MSKGKEVFDLLRQLARNAYFYLLSTPILRSFPIETPRNTDLSRENSSTEFHTIAKHLPLCYNMAEGKTFFLRGEL